MVRSISKSFRLQLSLWWGQQGIWWLEFFALCASCGWINVQPSLVIINVLQTCRTGQEVWGSVWRKSRDCLYFRVCLRFGKDWSLKKITSSRFLNQKGKFSKSIFEVFITVISVSKKKSFGVFLSLINFGWDGLWNNMTPTMEHFFWGRKTLIWAYIPLFLVFLDFPEFCQVKSAWLILGETVYGIIWLRLWSIFFKAKKTLICAYIPLFLVFSGFSWVLSSKICLINFGWDGLY